MNGHSDNEGGSSVFHSKQIRRNVMEDGGRGEG